jgi:hypothetical protein
MKYSLFKAKVYDCEHEGDLRAEVSLITEVIKPYGGKIGNHKGEPWYWDGVDNGEAYIYFMIPEEHIDEVKKDIYCQEMGIIYDEVAKKAIETSKKQFVSTLYKKLLDYEKQDLRSLRSLAKECKWECSEQELMQAAELSVVIACRHIATDSTKSLYEQYNEIVEIYNAQPIISPKDSVSRQLQQYSTPAPLAFLAGKYVQHNNPNEFETNRMVSLAYRFLEPSAGNGLLTLAFDPKLINVNEIDAIRQENLDLQTSFYNQGFPNVTDLDASDEQKMRSMFGSRYSGIITNPPFDKLQPQDYLTRSGKVGDNTVTYTFEELDHKMAIIALERMNNQGKAAIIIGGKLHEKYFNDNGRLFGRLKTFVTYLNRQYNLEDVIFINGDTIYQRQGTTFPIILLLINGRREWATAKTHQWRAYDETLDKPIQTFDELYARISPRLTGKTEADEADDNEHPKNEAYEKYRELKASANYSGDNVIILVRQDFGSTDCYMTYDADAERMSKITNIPCGKDAIAKCSVCGFAVNKLDTYLPLLVRAGLRVAIVDILEDPKYDEPIKRGVTEVIAPNPKDDEKEKRLRIAKAKIKIAKAKIKIAEAEQAGKRTKLNDMGEKIGGSAKDRYHKGEKSGSTRNGDKKEKEIYLAVDLWYGDIYASYHKNSNCRRKHYWNSLNRPQTLWESQRIPFVKVGTIAKFEEDWFYDLGTKYLYDGVSKKFKHIEDWHDKESRHVYEKYSQWLTNSQVEYLENHVYDEDNPYQTIYEYCMDVAKVKLAELPEENPKERSKAKEVYLHIRNWKRGTKAKIVFATYKQKFDNGTYRRGNYVTVLTESELSEIFGVENSYDNIKYDQIRDYIKANEETLKDKARTMLEAKFGTGFQDKAGLIAHERVGKDWRKGKDATEDDFLKVFGFRAVEFGETMPAKERKENFNRTYDSFMDLCDVCGFSPAAISLGGTLGICFGSRGKGGRGAASAHYEFDKKVINLTRKTGAGCLAHEWFHALDHSLSNNREAALDRLGDSNVTLLSDTTNKTLPVLLGAKTYESVKQEQENSRFAYDYCQWWKSDNICKRGDTAFALQCIITSFYLCKLYDDAKMLDKQGGKRKNGTRSGYWTQRCECGARSFEFYVIEKLKEKGYSNEYLAQIPQYNGVPETKSRSYNQHTYNIVTDKTIYPYPRPCEEEKQYIMAAYNMLFSTLMEVEGDIKNKKLNGIQ